MKLEQTNIVSIWEKKQRRLHGMNCRTLKPFANLAFHDCLGECPAERLLSGTQRPW